MAKNRTFQHSLLSYLRVIYFFLFIGYIQINITIKGLNKMSVAQNQALKPYQESITHEIGSLKTIVRLIKEVKGNNIISMMSMANHKSNRSDTS